MHASARAQSRTTCAIRKCTAQSLPPNAAASLSTPTPCHNTLLLSGVRRPNEHDAAASRRKSLPARAPRLPRASLCRASHRMRVQRSLAPAQRTYTLVPLRVRLTAASAPRRCLVAACARSLVRTTRAHDEDACMLSQCPGRGRERAHAHDDARCPRPRRACAVAAKASKAALALAEPATSVVSC